jgi:predicted DCC family thiol-disulfide oxidoreductase YuxK
MGAGGRMQVKDFDRHHFGLFRIGLGIYLFIHFAMLIPYGPELFGLQGTLASPSLNLTYPIFPNILYVWNTGAATYIFLSLLTALSGLLVLGWQRPWVAFALWYGWACLFNANNFISNPGLPYVGWMLLALALIPRGEAWALGERERADWEFPPVLYKGAWFLLAIGYGVSGVAKLMSPSWLDGTALYHLLMNPLSRDTPLRDFMVTLPMWMLKINTWGVLALEVLFPVLCLWPRMRRIAWVAMMALHFGILTIVDFADLTFGMLMIHLFVFEPWWIPGTQTKEKPVIFFDGVCGLCNAFVDFVFATDRRSHFVVSPLQGALAGQTLESPDQGVTDGDPKSVVLWQEGRAYRRSEAGIRILMGLGGIWGTARVLLLVPAGLRDAAYDAIARNRYRLFGKKDTCRMPTESERARFLP